MKGFSLFILLITGITLGAGMAFGQKVRIDNLNKGFEKVRTVSKFDCLHEAWSADSVEWVADMSIRFGHITPVTIKEIFKAFWEKANRLGANSFRVKESDIYNEEGEKFITLEAYWLRMERRNNNVEMFHSSSVYLFGFLGHHQRLKGYEVYFNDEKLLMHELSYKKFEFTPGEEIELRIGSKSRGETVKATIKANSFPLYYYFAKTTGGFQNAHIFEYEVAFAEFLLEILDQG